MSMLKAFYVSSLVDGKRKQFLTILPNEMKLFVNDALQLDGTVSIRIKKFNTSKEEFIKQLQQIIDEVEK